jgi:hypothetical protein
MEDGPENGHEEQGHQADETSPPPPTISEPLEIISSSSSSSSTDAVETQLHAFNSE